MNQLKRMQTNFYDISNDRQDKFDFNKATPLDVGTRNIEDDSVQVFSRSDCCSGRVDGPEMIVD